MWAGSDGSERASFITGADLAVDGGYAAIGPEAMGQAFEKVPVVELSRGVKSER